MGLITTPHGEPMTTSLVIAERLTAKKQPASVGQRFLEGLLGDFLSPSLYPFDQSISNGLAADASRNRLEHFKPLCRKYRIKNADRRTHVAQVDIAGIAQPAMGRNYKLSIGKRLRVIPVFFGDFDAELPDGQGNWNREIFVQLGQRLRGYFIKSFDIGACHVACH